MKLSLNKNYHVARVLIKRNFEGIVEIDVSDIFSSECFI